MFWYCETCAAWVPVLIFRTAWPDEPPGVWHTLVLCDGCQSSEVWQEAPENLECAAPPVGLWQRVTVCTLSPGAARPVGGVEAR